MVLSHSAQRSRRSERVADHSAWLTPQRRPTAARGWRPVNRIDNLRRASLTLRRLGQINEHTASMPDARVPIDACEGPGAPAEGKTNAAGDCKTEPRKAGISTAWRYSPAWTDAIGRSRRRQRLGPATGLACPRAGRPRSRAAAAAEFCPSVRPVSRRPPVHKDCMVHFEGRVYTPVPFLYVVPRVRSAAARERAGRPIRERPSSSVATPLTTRSGSL